MPRIALIALFFLFSALGTTAQPPLGWPEVIARLATEKSQAVTCVGLLKSRGDPAIQQAKSIYGNAKAQSDGAIAGLLVLLDEGGRPEILPLVQDQFAASGVALRQICEAATKDAKPGEKGVWDELAKVAVEPLVNQVSAGVAGLWTRHVDLDRLERESKRTQLEAARWPEFADISAR